MGDEEGKDTFFALVTPAQLAGMLSQRMGAWDRTGMVFCSDATLLVAMHRLGVGGRGRGGRSSGGGSRVRGRGSLGRSK